MNMNFNKLIYQKNKILINSISCYIIYKIYNNPPNPPNIPPNFYLLFHIFDNNENKI
jgi:hypothetical protein